MTKTEKQLKSAANKAQEFAIALRKIDYAPVGPILEKLQELQNELMQVRAHLAGIGTTPTARLS